MKSKISLSTSLLKTLFAVLAFSLSSLIAAGTQEQAVPPSNQQESQDPAKTPGLAQQLTRDTREAAGEDEKDDKAVFKQSGSVRWIAKTFGISTEKASLLAFLFNFAVIAGIVVWAMRKYLPGAFADRTAAIQKAMQEAQKASEEARRRLAEIESRLMKLDVEIGMMRDSAEKEASAEEARIHAAAEEDARKMVEGAQQEIAAAAKSARRALSAYAADLAVGLAQKQIRVDTNTDQNLVRRFAKELTAASVDMTNTPGKDRN